MNQVEQLRADTAKALALLAHAVAEAVDAKTLLLNVMANWRALQKPGPQVDGLDQLAHAMVMALSSIALKQRPEDPEVQDLYKGLRPGSRN